MVNQTFVFEINKNTDAMLGESFGIPLPCDKLYIELDITEEYAVMGYIVILDEKGRVRLQKLAGYGQRRLWIGDTSDHTSLGGVPGPIGAGQWELRIYLFTEYIEQMLGDRTFTFSVHIMDGGEDRVVPGCVGAQSWIHADTFEDGLMKYQDYDWNQSFGSEGKWYKGDFHTHTRLSDGKETVAHATENAIAMGMDFYVPTEHNVIHTGWVDTDLMVVPGVEITTEKGHCNLFGIDRMPAQLLDILGSMAKDEAQAYMHLTIEEARERGWLVSINHPFLHIWKWLHMETQLRLVNCMEIVNDPTYEYAKESNDQAIRFLDWLWQDGHRIYGVGGSDSHNLIDERYKGATEPSVVGDPGTYVYMEELTPENLLSGVEAGHMYVSRHCTLAVEITDKETGREYVPGDEILCQDGSVTLKYRVVIEGWPGQTAKGAGLPGVRPMQGTPEVCRVENRVRTRVEVQDLGDGSYLAETEVVCTGEGWQWMRLDIRDADGEFLAYVNPVWCGAKEHRYETFGQALLGLKEEEGETV